MGNIIRETWIGWFGNLSPLFAIFAVILILLFISPFAPEWLGMPDHKYNLKMKRIKIIKVVEDGKVHYEIWKRWLLIFCMGYGGDYAVAWEYSTYEEAEEDVKKILKNIPDRIEEEIVSL